MTDIRFAVFLLFSLLLLAHFFVDDAIVVCLAAHHRKRFRFTKSSLNVIK